MVGVCGECGVDRVEGEVLYCDNECEEQERCVPGRARCVNNVREVCDQLGQWESLVCGGDENCFEVNEIEVECVPRDCVPDSLSCGEMGESIERCDTLGRSREELERCQTVPDV